MTNEKNNIERRNEDTSKRIIDVASQHHVSCASAHEHSKEKPKLKPLSTPTPILVIKSFKEFEEIIEKKPDEETIKFLSDCRRVHDRHKILT